MKIEKKLSISEVEDLVYEALLNKKQIPEKASVDFVVEGGGQVRVEYFRACWEEELGE